MKILAKAAAVLLLVLLHGWAIAALWIDAPPSRSLFLVLLYAGVLVGVVAFRGQIRPLFLVSLTPFVVVLAWWGSLAPSNDRDWMSDVARTAHAEIEGDQVTIHNLRNFDYRSEDDYTERWETRSYDLSKLRGVDLFLSTWGSPYIAHTIASWDFGDGNHLAISIETRKEKAESYSAILGFFRQFELYYVVADERDLVRLRTNFRDETVRLYQLTASREVARAVLLDYLKEINALSKEPVWYNALTHNCTTTIRHHVQHVAQGNPLDWRIIVNGRIDELGYERGNVDTSLPFEELRRVSDIGERARPEVSISALGGRRFDARLTEFAATADPKTRTFAATLAFDNPGDVNLASGMTANVRIRVPDELLGQTGIQVPSVAVSSNASGTPIVWVVDRNTMAATAREVEVGMLSGDLIRVTKGLTGNEWIAASGVHFLHDGMIVSRLGE